MDPHSTHNNPDNRTSRLVVTALMICLIVLGTILFRIPVPMTQGYIHLGDTMIYLGVLLLGKKGGTSAACLGSALGDILGGYAFWAPWTLAIKFAMAFTAGTIIETRISRGSDRSDGQKPGRRLTLLYISGMTAGGLVMCAGYLIAERVMYGTWGAAFIGLPWNFGQFTAGIVLSLAIYQALSGVPYLKEFRHN